MLDLGSARALEEALLDPEVRRSPELLGALIADDFVEYGSSGRVFGKDDVLESAERLPDVETPLADFRVAALGDGAALITYRSTTRLADGSRSEALRSSVWVYAGDHWRLRFHQGTIEATDPERISAITEREMLP